MVLNKDVDDREQIARILLTAALAAVAVRLLRRGKRPIAVLVGVGAIALGYSTATGLANLKEESGVDPIDRDEGMRCSICGEPIAPGQSRGPNSDNEIVHEACMEPAR